MCVCIYIYIYIYVATQGRTARERCKVDLLLVIVLFGLVYLAVRPSVAKSRV